MEFSTRHDSLRFLQRRSRTRPKVRSAHTFEQVCHILCPCLKGVCLCPSVHFTRTSSLSARILPFHHDVLHIHHGILDVHTEGPGRHGGSGGPLTKTTFQKVPQKERAALSYVWLGRSSRVWETPRRGSGGKDRNDNACLTSLFVCLTRFGLSVLLSAM